MTLIGFKGQNHPQQIARRGANPTVDERATSPEMFDPLNLRFAFTIDVAALPHNRKLPRYFAPPGPTIWDCMWRSECPPDCPCPTSEQFPVAVDGLAQSWAGERVWCNPPYSSIEAWVEKAWSETAAELVVMLLPANRTEQGWWQRWVEPHRDAGGLLRVEFLRGRPRFICVGETEVLPNQRPPFGCCLLIWSRRDLRSCPDDRGLEFAQNLLHEAYRREGMDGSYRNEVQRALDAVGSVRHAQSPCGRWGACLPEGCHSPAYWTQGQDEL